MINKNDELIGTVISFGSNGEGIIKHDGFVVFLPLSIPLEKVKYKVLKVTSKCAYGKVISVLEKSADRVEPKCPVFSKCGGCQLQHLAYEKQLSLKKQTVEDCFNKIAFLPVNVQFPVHSNKNFGYRNKLQLPVGQGNNGAEIGFYAENSHRVIPIDDCPINPEWTKTVIACFKKYIKEFNLSGYNEQNFSGDIREITVKEIGKNLIITLVVTDFKIKGIDRLIEILKENLGCEFSLFLNENKSRSNVIYGEKFCLKYGKGEYFSELFGIKYPVGVRSFTQINNEVCALLYDRVKKELNLNENTVVIDAYSGAGLMTAILAKEAKKAIGIEIIKEATLCADKLAKENNLEHKITNYCAPCEDVLPSIVEEEKSKGQTLAIVLDPPRKGCDVKVLQAVKNSGADRIVYVSCLPSSLARDVGILTGTLKEENGKLIKSPNPDGEYEVTLVQPFDMFPQTKHVETLVCLCKKAN